MGIRSRFVPVAAAALLAVGCSGGGAESSSEAVADGAPEELAMVEPDAVVLEELRLALPRPVSLDPTELDPSDQAAVVMADLLHDGLTEVVATAGRLRPALATEWSADADLRVWQFELDTDRVSAEAAAVSLAAFLGDDALVSAEGDSVVVELAVADAGLPWRLSAVEASIVVPGGEPTGRYELAFETDEGMTLAPSWGEGPTVAVEWTPSAGDAYQRLTLGTVDAAIVPTDLMGDAQSRLGVVLPARGPVRYVATTGNSTFTSATSWRQALLGSLDAEALAAEIGGQHADGLVAASVAGYRAGACAIACVTDAESIPATGDDAVVRLGTTGLDPLASAVAGQLRDAGFEVEVQVLDDDGLARSVEAGEIDLVFATVPPIASLDGLVPTLVGLDDGGVVGALVEQARYAETDVERWAVLAEAHEAGLADARWLPVTVERSRLVTAPQVSGLAVRADGSIDLGLWAGGGDR